MQTQTGGLMTASGWRKAALVVIVIWVALRLWKNSHQSNYSTSPYSGDSGGSAYFGDGSSRSSSASSDDEEAGSSSSSDADDGGEAGGGGGGDD